MTKDQAMLAVLLLCSLILAFSVIYFAAAIVTGLFAS
jgi:hypothetical protein